MELLTTSGWSSSNILELSKEMVFLFLKLTFSFYTVNDIESILIQIRSEMMEGGAQLDRSGKAQDIFANSSLT